MQTLFDRDPCTACGRSRDAHRLFGHRFRSADDEYDPGDSSIIASFIDSLPDFGSDSSDAGGDCGGDSGGGDCGGGDGGGGE